MAQDDPGAAFKTIGGELCLDFVNTVSGRVSGSRAGARDWLDQVERERLVGYDDLVRWARTVELVDSGEAAALGRAAHAAAAHAGQVVARARVLREAVYRIFRAAVQRWEPAPADLEVLNRELSRARAHEGLVADGRRVAYGWKSDGELDRLLWPVARSAAELLTGDRLDRVSQCGGADCHWLFLDTSKNRSRRWCDMADCGNLAKVRRFRER